MEEVTPTSLKADGDYCSERTMSSSTSSKRKQKKYRYKRQPQQRCNRDEVRRIEAKSFLSSITLDSRSRSPNTSYILDKDKQEEPTSPNVLRRMQDSSILEQEEGMANLHANREFQRLHEMAADMFSLQTPQKSSYPRSHDHDFEHASPLAYNVSTPMARALSLVDSSATALSSHTSVPDHLSRKNVLVHSNSLGGTPLASMGGTGAEYTNCGTNVRLLRPGTR